jgi:hypothetical protein
MQKEGNKDKQGVRGIITIILPEKKYNFTWGGGGMGSDKCKYADSFIYVQYIQKILTFSPA